MSHLGDLQSTMAPAIMEADFQQETGSHPLWQPIAATTSSDAQANPSANNSADVAQPEPAQSASANAGANDVSDHAASTAEVTPASSSAQQHASSAGTQASASVQQAGSQMGAGMLSESLSEDGELDADMDIDTDMVSVPAATSAPKPEGQKGNASSLRCRFFWSVLQILVPLVLPMQSHPAQQQKQPNATCSLQATLDIMFIFVRDSLTIYFVSHPLTSNDHSRGHLSCKQALPFLSSILLGVSCSANPQLLAHPDMKLLIHRCRLFRALCCR